MSRRSRPIVFVVILASFSLAAGLCWGDIELGAPNATFSEGDREIRISWTDPDPEGLTYIADPVLGTPQFPWRGNAGIEVGGFYVGACDWSYDVVVISSPDSITLRWDEVRNWTTKALRSRSLRVTETDLYYELSDGIQAKFTSEGLFNLAAEGWNGPEPTFHGIYRGGVESAPDQPVVFDFLCTSGGEIEEVGGGEVTLHWQDDQGREGTVVVTGAGQDIEVHAGLMVSFQAGAFFENESFTLQAFMPLISADRFTIRAYTFDGYLVLRHSVEDRPNQYKVISNINKCDNPELFQDENGNPDPYGTRYFLDKGVESGPGVIPDPNMETVLNGFPYDYAVVTYDVFPNDSLGTSPIDWVRVFPSVPPSSSAEDTYVVPNPYTRRTGWEVGEAKIQFVNIPPNAVIRIYDASGGYINTVRPSYKIDGSQAGTADWNLRDSNGEDVVSGIYIYRIESGSGGKKLGRFIVVR